MSLKFYLNGKLCEVSHEHASLMLSDYLRYEKCLTGTKVVCAEGDCGACTVLRYHPHLQGVDADNFVSINSCIMPLALLHGSHILTIESLQKDKELHPIQKCMVDCHASQCGFCTPGFVMALAGLSEEKLAKKSYQITESEGKNALTGNLCRCTGYDSIIKASTQIDLKEEISLKERYHSKEIEKHLRSINSEDFLIETEHFCFYAPTTYTKALDYLNAHENVKIIASATDLGVVHNKRKLRLNHLLSLHLIPESYQIGMTNDVVEVGSRVTLTEFRHFLKDYLEEYANYLDIFASPQIKNNATLVGNIANASPIGDNAPVLLALDGEVELISKEGIRTQKLSSFFLGYRHTALAANELIKSVRFKLPKDSVFKLFKIVFVKT
jgi:xanthine dehydrogenase small subunit